MSFPNLEWYSQRAFSPACVLKAFTMSFPNLAFAMPLPNLALAMSFPKLLTKVPVKEQEQQQEASESFLRPRLHTYSRSKSGPKSDLRFYRCLNKRVC